MAMLFALSFLPRGVVLHPAAVIPVEEIVTVHIIPALSIEYEELTLMI